MKRAVEESKPSASFATSQLESVESPQSAELLNVARQVIAGVRTVITNSRSHLIVRTIAAWFTTNPAALAYKNEQTSR